MPKEKRKLNITRLILDVVLSFIVASGLITLLVINSYQDPQENYGEYLIEKNNEFVKHMYDFTGIFDSLDTFTPEEKTAKLNEMSEMILEQNEIVKQIKNIPSGPENSDYTNLGESIYQLYLFALQGEIYLLEQGYNPPEERSQTLLGMGDALIGTMGGVIVQLPGYINDVRDTDYKADYEYADAGIELDLGNKLEDVVKDMNTEDFSSELNEQIESVTEG